MHGTSLYESQIGGISYEHSHTLCVPVSCDYCDFIDHDVNTCPLLGRPHRIEELATFNREICLQNLLQTDLRLRSPAPKARSYDDFDVRNEPSIPLGNDCYDDKHSDDLQISSDPSSPFASSLETSTSLDTSKDCLLYTSPSPRDGLLSRMPSSA